MIAWATAVAERVSASTGRGWPRDCLLAASGSPSSDGRPLSHTPAEGAAGGDSPQCGRCFNVGLAFDADCGDVFTVAGDAGPPGMTIPMMSFLPRPAQNDYSATVMETPSQSMNTEFDIGAAEIEGNRGRVIHDRLGRGLTRVPAFQGWLVLPVP